MRNTLKDKWFEVTNFFLGAALAWGAIMFSQHANSAANAVIVGTAIACFSVIGLWRYTAWAEWSNLILGGWAVAAPFTLGFGEVQAAVLVHLFIGLCVVTIATIQLQKRWSRRTRSLASQ
ncbi:hypothetical protein IZ6_12790 [Terrihabitans soli]|uniref:SPW repeat-containing integral membrane domain-containing protein n=1 Tax=Terrihabitans soli TaxID=708113 RepID=A0A6S6QJR0_9HYPH|nr:SPW repeat protein [Terrihabitans soli]BCJ90544.1 hypothetical protein IZ6_12790 [Terrihabitans soli]